MRRVPNARPTLTLAESLALAMKVDQSAPAARDYRNARREREAAAERGEQPEEKPQQFRRLNRADFRAARSGVGATRKQRRRGWVKPGCVCGRILRPFQLAPCEHCRAEQAAKRAAAEAVSA